MVLLLPGFCLCVCEVEPTLFFALLLVIKFLNLDIFSGSYNSSGWKPLCCCGGGGLYFVFVVFSLLTDCCLFSKYSPSTRACSHGYTEQHAQRVEGRCGLSAQWVGGSARRIPRGGTLRGSWVEFLLGTVFLT